MKAILDSRVTALRRLFFSAVIGMALGGSASTAAAATAQMRFLTDDGTPLSPTPGGWIDVLTFGQMLDFDGQNTTPVLDRFRFFKRVDATSPKLRRALLTDAVLSRAQLRVRQPGAGGSIHDSLLVEFNQVSVNSIHVSGLRSENETAITENVAIQFGTISWVYRTPGEDSRSGSWVHDLIYGTGDAARDDDGDGIINPIDPDDDNDLIPDRAEIMLRMNPIVADSAVDSDGDGATNEQEYLAGTDVFDPNSRFGIERITLDVSGASPTATLTVPTIGDRRYRVLATVDGNSWMPVADFTTEADEAPRAREVELSPGVAGMLRNLIFRVAVDLPPTAPQ